MSNPAAGPPSAVEETRRQLVFALALLRLAQLGQWAPVAAAGRWEIVYRHTEVALGAFAVACLWSIGLFARGFARRDFGRRWLVADVLFAAVNLFLVGWACAPGYRVTWQNWTIAPSMGAALMAAVYLGRRQGLIAGVILVSAYVAGVWPDLRKLDSNLGSGLGNIASPVLFTIIGVLVIRRLLASADDADQATATAMAAQQREAAATAQLAERVRQHRLLHDTVIRTMDEITRRDDVDSEVRERCRAEATYLRGLITSSPEDTPSGLGALLAEVMRDHAMHGLRTSPQIDGLPHTIPAEVSRDIADAVREALNNVAKHAFDRSPSARLSAVGNGRGGVTVTVADRGCGFDPATVKAGWGLTHSLRHRIEGIGGAVEITSAPGEGTVVELRWPA